MIIIIRFVYVCLAIGQGGVPDQVMVRGIRIVSDDSSITVVMIVMA
jgi:hypothetical protein